MDGKESAMTEPDTKTLLAQLRRLAMSQEKWEVAEAVRGLNVTAIEKKLEHSHPQLGDTVQIKWAEDNWRDHVVTKVERAKTKAKGDWYATVIGVQSGYENYISPSDHGELWRHAPAKPEGGDGDES